MEGKKNDFLDKKLRWDLLPLEEIEDIVKVYTAGSIKYGDNNWQNLENGYQRYKAAMLRHLLEYEKGNTIDEDTGCHHLAQVAWNAIAMLWISKHTFRKATVEDLSKALDERIEEKINSCNDILDKIQLSSKEELDRRSEFDTISGLKKEISRSIRELSKELAKKTNFNYWLSEDETGAIIEDNNKNVVKGIFTDRNLYGSNEEVIAKLCSYKDRLKDLVEETIYEYNKGKSRTGDSVLSDSDKQVSE
jgi:hypothetical protein